MKQLNFVCVSCLAAAVAGCGDGGQSTISEPVAAGIIDEVPSDDVVRPKPRPSTLTGIAVLPDGVVDPLPTELPQSDTTEVSEQTGLGTTIASLGNPAEPGLWLETPLVSAEGAGRIVYQGVSAEVTLRPIEGPRTAGSRLSLSAMRLIGASLTDLPELEVFLN